MIECCLQELYDVGDSLENSQVEGLVEVLYQAYRENRQIFIFGNGGSAATASHFCEDIGKGTLRGLNDRRRFRVVSLTDNTPYLLAWANDEGYERVFEQQLCNLADEGDVAIGISGSGNSENVLRAIEYANLRGMITVGMTGFDGGRLAQRVTHLVHVPSFNMGMVENFHLIVSHLVVEHLKTRARSRAVFLDRDGVINEERPDYVKSWDEFSWIPGAKEALQKLREDGFLAVIVTNQSAVGRGLLDIARLEEIHEAMVDEIEDVGGGIDKIYYCPHLPDAGCDCRKPKPGLLLKAAGEFDIHFPDSYMVTDSIRHVAMARDLGCTTVLVCNGRSEGSARQKVGSTVKPDYTLPDLASAVEIILNQNGDTRGAVRPVSKPAEKTAASGPRTLPPTPRRFSGARR